MKKAVTRAKILLAALAVSPALATAYPSTADGAGAVEPPIRLASTTEPHGLALLAFGVVALGLTRRPPRAGRVSAPRRPILCGRPGSR